MKTEVRNEFILEAHKSACSEWKLKIEKECHELFKLEINKWYLVKHNCLPNALIYLQDFKTERTYGFNHSLEYTEIYRNDLLHTNFKSDVLRKATEEEVKEALIKEAKKRGFIEGVKIKLINSQKTGVIDLQYKTDYEDSIFWYGGYAIFKQGQWAEIISNTIEKKINDLQKQIDELKKQL